jgi:hypothetical protein
VLVGTALWALPEPGRDTANAAADPVIAAGGDIACDPDTAHTATACHQAETAALLTPGGYDAVLPLGDQQYECGAASAYQASYDPTWGQVKGISHPVAGDNDYSGSTCATPGASGYFNYFGSAAGTAGQGWYSYDLGSWHVIALNSECRQIGGCGATSAQGTWLKAELAAHPNSTYRCTLVTWHRPRFGDNGSGAAGVKWMYKFLYKKGADVLLTGHIHLYERFAPQDPSGVLDPANGIREFIVGTGGRNHAKLAATPPANSQARQNTTFGILSLTLHAGSYDWQFVPETGGSFTDTGTGTCH